MGTAVSFVAGRLFCIKNLQDVVFVDFPVDDVQVVGYFNRNDVFLRKVDWFRKCQTAHDRLT